jgi:pimeloyl-ACP methyl ester carboxylesterase
MLQQEALKLRTEDGADVDAMLHFDDAKPPTAAVTIMHPTSDWRHHYILPLLAERGVAALGFTTRYTAREADLILEHTILDTAAGVKLLRERGFQHVVSIGNSGGGEIVTVYQAEAEHPTITQTPLGTPPDLTKAHLPPLDGLIILNAHRGRAHSLTRSLDPSVGGEDGNDPFVYDPDLDMYNPKNGPPYPAEFQARYHAAQVERNHKITRWCQRKLAELSKLGNPLLVDVTFIVHRTDANLCLADLTIDPSDRTGRTIWDEDPKVANYTPGPLRGGATRLRIMTLRSWISQRGLATSVFDVMEFLPRCHVPVLFIVGTADASGGPADSLEMLKKAPDPDKRLVWLKGGTHFMRGQPELQAEAADAIVQWLRDRSLFA